MSNISLPTHTTEKIRAILQEFVEVKEGFVFGSRAKKNARASSDIDLAIKAPGLTYERYVTLRRKLNEALLYKVDVVHLDQVQDRELARMIKETAKRIYLSR